MNPIAIWSKFKDYGNWCYQYRIPTESEFVQGFEFEYITYMYTRLKDGSTKPFLDVDYDIVPVSWEKRVVLNVIDKYFIWSLIPIQYGIQHKLPQHHLQSYLEEGHIRVKKTDERKDNINNIQSNIMKLFYYELGLRKGIEFNEKGKIKQLGSTALREGQFKYAVALAENPNEGLDQIIKQFGIKNDPMGELHKVLHGYDKQYGYYMIHSGGNELTINEFDKLQCFSNEVLNTVEATTEFIRLFAKKKKEDKIVKSKKEIKDKWVNRVKPNLKIIKDLIPGSRGYHFEKIDIEIPILDESGKKQYIIDRIIKQSKSVNNKGKEFIITRAVRKLLTKTVEIIKKVKDVPKVYNYPPKPEWKPIIKPICYQPEKSPNRLVCVATKDRKKFKRITWKWANYLITKTSDKYEYISKEEFRKLSAPIPGRSFTPRLGEIGYTPKAKIVPNKSSSKVAKCKRKSKHHQQGIKKTKFSNKYEVSFFHQQKEGSAEFVYQQFAKTEDQAIYKAGVRLEVEGADLAYFKPKVKLLEQGSNKVSTKKDSLTKLIILPKVLDLPVWKNKKGEVIPWTKKVSQITTDEERAKGEGIFKMIDKEITTYTKYEVGYERFDKSPFNKTPKKWKCPISEYKTKKYLQRKIKK